jgi:hypothetical protein
VTSWKILHVFAISTAFIFVRFGSGSEYSIQAIRTCIPVDNQQVQESMGIRLDQWQ